MVRYMFLYLIANTLSTKQNTSNLWSVPHLACSHRTQRSLSPGLSALAECFHWQSSTTLRLYLAFKIHNSIRKKEYTSPHFNLHIQQNSDDRHLPRSVYHMLNKGNVKMLRRRHFCIWSISKLGWKGNNQNWVYTRLHQYTIHLKSLYYTLYSWLSFTRTLIYELLDKHLHDAYETIASKPKYTIFLVYCRIVCQKALVPIRRIYCEWPVSLLC